MKSNNLPAVDGPQVEMPFRVIKTEPTEVDITLIRKQPTFSKAIALCISYGGFEYDNQVYLELGIDAGHWTRIMNGSAHFPINKLEELMDLCGNESPLLWLADHRGYELKRKLSTIEAELMQEKERNKELEMKLAHYKEFVSIGGVP